MKKLSAKHTFLGVVTLGILTVSVASMGGFGKSNNKWNSNMIKDSSTAGSSSKTTTNLSTGQKYNSDGTPQGAAEAVAADELAYGEGSLNCREAVVKVVTVFDSPSSAGTSEIKVPELEHKGTRTVNCKDVTPQLVNSYGAATTGGTITIKCGNGQLNVVASNCTAPTPPPGTGGDTGGGGGTAGTPAPTPAAPAGYSVRACSAWCSDTVTKCTKTSAKNSSSTYSFRVCQSGQVYFTSSGTCGARPANCK